ncbi:hypothetical protein MESS2_1370024 [Mesorhizobium metallidurans STM 2683]|uniref:Uncharacterized protein n=1 Tax=Mesorhizobium metallidurans STM 2683 TaxID=1297569 RepID=M5EK47_9HYPH|nr:hypothetical protein MESS2_1370024 [Mesorhizobium metallidurans STM 2683]
MWCFCYWLCGIALNQGGAEGEAVLPRKRRVPFCKRRYSELARTPKSISRRRAGGMPE